MKTHRAAANGTWFAITSLCFLLPDRRTIRDCRLAVGTTPGNRTGPNPARWPHQPVATRNRANQSGGNEIETFRADSLFRLHAERLSAIGEKVRARDFAFHQHRMASALPSDSVRHLSADASLLGEHHSAAIAAQPMDGFRD